MSAVVYTVKNLQILKITANALEYVEQVNILFSRRFMHKNIHSLIYRENKCRPKNLERMSVSLIATTDFLFSNLAKFLIVQLYRVQRWDRFHHF